MPSVDKISSYTCLYFFAIKTVIQKLFLDQKHLSREFLRHHIKSDRDPENDVKMSAVDVKMASMKELHVMS